MKFNQRYLEEQLSTYVNGKQPIVIFTTESEKIELEKLLLQFSKQGAFFHVQVTTCRSYLLNLLKKNRLFSYRLLSKATGLVAAKASLEIEGLHYFQGLEVDAGLLNTLLSAYEMMADVDLLMPVVRNGMSEEKWIELKQMYQKFQQIKGDELFDAEIYQKAIPYLEENVQYVSFTHQPYSRSWEMFLEASHAVVLDDADVMGRTDYEKSLDKFYHQLQVQSIPNFPANLYEVQFAHQEIELAISQIEKFLFMGYRYNEIAVYVPDSAFLESFIRRCPFPCRYEPQMVNTSELAFLDYLWLYLKEPNETNRQTLLYLSKMENLLFDEWLERFIQGTTSTRLEALSQIVCADLLEAAYGLPENLTLADFVLFTQMLIQTSTKQTSEASDRIEIVSYQSPLLAKHFKEVILCGLNEDIYPSKISDKGLILNEELQPYYVSGTPLDHQNEQEWEWMKEILVSADHYTMSCHYGSLDGTDSLPSLLFNHLKVLKGIKDAPTYSLSMTNEMSADPILDQIAQSELQPHPLTRDLALSLYPKHGRLQISPSELESFNQCPFKHFMRYGLKLFPKKSKLETSARFGTLMHDLLDHCSALFGLDFDERLAKLETKYQLILNPDVSIDERLALLVDAMITQENFSVENTEDQYLLGQFRPQFLNILKMLLYHVQEGQFELTYHELPISEKYGDVTYVGRIDRADVYGDYLKIIDYKSSGKSLDLGLCMQGFNIQMLVYLEILAKQKKLKKGAALYFNTSPKKLEANGKMNLDATNADDFIKAYQMEGWLLEDDLHQVMYGLDQNFVESKICHIRYVKSRDEYTGRLLKAEQWDHLIENIFKRMHEIVDSCFYQGDIRIYPAGGKDSAMRMKVSPCRYCDYSDVCLRDPFYHEEREIKQYSKEELERLLKGEKLDESSHSV